jgi:pilus assembly protein Flp/PilA
LHGTPSAPVISLQFDGLRDAAFNLLTGFQEVGWSNLPNLSRHEPILRLQLNQLRRTVVKQILAKFLADERGATAIEYGLIAAGISLAIIAAVNGLGTNLNAKFTSINSSLK